MSVSSRIVVLALFDLMWVCDLALSLQAVFVSITAPCLGDNEWIE